MARKVERKLVVELVPRQKLAAPLAGEGSGVFDLGGDAPHYQSGWTMVSHTFTIQNDGSGVITYIMEKQG